MGGRFVLLSDIVTSSCHVCDAAPRERLRPCRTPRLIALDPHQVPAGRNHSFCSAAAAFLYASHLSLFHSIARQAYARPYVIPPGVPYDSKTIHCENRLRSVAPLPQGPHPTKQHAHSVLTASPRLKKFLSVP